MVEREEGREGRVGVKRFLEYDRHEQVYVEFEKGGGVGGQGGRYRMFMEFTGIHDGQPGRVLQELLRDKHRGEKVRGGYTLLGIHFILLLSY